MGESFRLPAKKILAVYWVCLFFIFPLNGEVILIYGTPCAGKSMLTQQLINELPGDYATVKKTSLVEQKRRDMIEKLTGRRPQHHGETIAAMVDLPPQQSRRVNRLSDKALKETLQEIKRRAMQGENLIFDVCLKNGDVLDDFQEVKVLKVLVHAPLSCLTKRDLERSFTKVCSLRYQQRRRNAILCLYSHLYRPVENDDEEAIGTLSREELEAFYRDSGEEIVYQKLKIRTDRIIKEFGLDEAASVKIVPRVPPDLLIQSGEWTIAESAQRVKEVVNQ